MNKLWYRPPPLTTVNGQIINLGSRQFSEQRLRKIVSKLCQRTHSTYTVNLNILSQIEIFAFITFPIFSFAHLFERNRDIAGLGYMLNSW